MAQNNISGDVTKGTYVEWKIPESFFLLPEDEWVRSPSFSSFGCSWFLGARLLGGALISFLKRQLDDLGPAKVNASFAVGVKSPSGNVVEKHFAFDATFKKGYWKGWFQLLPREELHRWRDDEAPWGCNLHVTCRLTQKDVPEEQGRAEMNPQRMEFADQVSELSCLESLSEDLSRLLLEEGIGPEPDITLTFGNDQVIRAHKVILSARSPVFAAMLRNDMTERRTGVVEMEQDMVEPASIDLFLKYLYSGKLSADMTADTAKGLYELGDKYAVAGLMTLCAHFLEENLDSDNVCEVLALADAHSDKKLKERAMLYIMDEKIHLQDALWLPFCECQPVLAVEVLNRICRLSSRE